MRQRRLLREPFADQGGQVVHHPAEGLTALAPEKDSAAIDRSMARMAVHIGESRTARKEQAAQAIVSMPQSRTTRRASAPLFAPGGQSTQMIVGADATDDRTILATSARLYGTHRLRRVYYSAFSPIPDAARALPLAAPPTVREHRLYQADWLMRFYGFTHDEIVPPSQVGMLALDMDPKLAWALAHRERFPVNLNTAPRELLLRVPGFGVQTVDRLLAARPGRRTRVQDMREATVAEGDRRGRSPAHDGVVDRRPGGHRGGVTEVDEDGLVGLSHPSGASARQD